jgi:hypothetical protein
VAQGETASALNDYWQEIASKDLVIEQQVVSDRADNRSRSTTPTQEICSKKNDIELDSSSEETAREAGLTEEESIRLAYSSGAALERKSLLKIWCACVVGTALSFSLVSGVRDIRSLVTTSLSAGSVAFVVSAIGKKE